MIRLVMIGKTSVQNDNNMKIPVVEDSYMTGKWLAIQQGIRIGKLLVNNW